MVTFAHPGLYLMLLPYAIRHAQSRNCHKCRRIHAIQCYYNASLSIKAAKRLLQLPDDVLTINIDHRVRQITLTAVAGIIYG